MPPLTLEGDTLGKKHQNFNKLVKDTIANKHYTLTKINEDDSDIENLLKIDVASKTRDVDYIIEVLQSDDMLYVSRAIKSSTWLITDQQYAHIINPEYLHTQLFPHMSTKAINKLMLHIRLSLKDDKRVEDFYTYLKETKDGHKWLENCSIPFIENVLQNGPNIPLNLFKRLCKRSKVFLAYYKKVESSWQYRRKEELLLLLKSDTEEVLKIMEKDDCNMVKMNRKHTKIIMKKCPQRILDKFEMYIGDVDLSVVAQYLKKEEIKPFLYKQMKNERVKNYLKQYKNLKHFIKNMPESERFEFIKNNFIDKTVPAPCGDMDVVYADEGMAPIPCDKTSYSWYEFAPFNTAFTEIKKLIRAENSPSERCEMLSVLVKCTKRNPQHIKTLLKHYYEKHINEPFKFKVQFVNNILTQINIHKIDVESWKILDQLFHSMEVYTELENNVKTCLIYIVLYKVLHDENIPEIVEKKLTFDSFKTLHRSKQLSQEQKDKIFEYLLNIHSKNIETLEQSRNILILINDWKKDIKNYPLVLDKIRRLIKSKKDTTEIKEFSCLFNIKKTWRKHMFEESLILHLSEEACLNALKHEPELLTRCDKEVAMLRADDSVSLRRLLTKLRVYWPQSFAQQWTAACLQNINKPTEQKALIRGLFMLLSRKEITQIATKHELEDIKINWGETDQAEISLRKNIAQQLHVARPQTPLDIVLKYAKGDYLEYAVPSLNAILHNLSKLKSCEYVPKLLDAPASLQKFGLHLAYKNMKSEELNPLFSKIWKATKNSTIRSVLFNHTYGLLCKVKNVNSEKELWQLLIVFINNLTPEENKTIYKTLSKAKNVPISVRAEFYMKSYVFLTSLPQKANCETYVKDLSEYAPSIMESLDEDFVVKKLLSPIQTKFCEGKHIELFACYVLCGKTEDDQLFRFRKVLVPAMEYTFQSWNNIKEDQYYVRDNFIRFFKYLAWNSKKLITLNRIIIPAKLFTEIKLTIKEKISLQENYVLYTSWNLTTEYVKLLDEQKSEVLCAFEESKFLEFNIGCEWMPDEMKNVWKKINVQISSKLGPIFVKILKADVEEYFPTIYHLFSNAVLKMFDDMCYHNEEFKLNTLEHMLIDKDFISSYLVVSKCIPQYVNENLSEKLTAIREKVKSHPSKEVQMHYCRIFGNIV